MSGTTVGGNGSEGAVSVAYRKGRKTWTPGEDDILRQFYPEGGFRAVYKAIEKANIHKRTHDSIANRCNRLGLIRVKALKCAREEYVDKIEHLHNVELRHVVHALRVSIDETTNDLRGFLDRWDVLSAEIERRRYEE